MRAIAYYRVSTERQGRSGLGLDAQRAMVEGYVRGHGGEILAEYVEVESGRRCDRPQLARALGDAKAYGATLMIARLDRLARNVAFTSALLESGADFCACDNPHANKLTIHILAAIAEYESDLISMRTKAAMAQAKLRGRVFGAHDPRCRGGWLARTGRITEVQARALRERRRRAQEFLGRVAPIVRAMIGRGMKLRAIAGTLNESGIRTRMGKMWSDATLSRIMREIAAAAAPKE